MFRKNITKVMLFTAFAIMLGHNIFPHHHHDSGQQEELDHHHSHGNHDHDDQEDGDFGHIFSSFLHGSNGIDFLSSQSTNHTYSKQPFFLAGVLQHPDSFSYSLVQVRQNSPPYKYIYFDPFQLLPSGLRAPPLSIA